MSTSTQRESVDFALNVLGKAQGTTQVQTAKTRTGLETLMRLDPTKISPETLDVPALARDLFNWGGDKKATKPLIKAFANSISSPKTYAKAVELTSFVSAVSTLLEPDRLARLYNTLDKVDTVFAPARYTLQFTHTISNLLGSYPQERLEKLLLSLWIDSHNGRWWELTSGEEIDILPNPDDNLKQQDILAQFYDGTSISSPKSIAIFKKIKYSRRLYDYIKEYNNDYAHGRMLNPEVALLISNIPWLPIADRPETPVVSLVKELSRLVTDYKIELAKKPKVFSELFPNMNFSSSGLTFPFDPMLYTLTNNITLPDTHARIEIVKNTSELSENRTYMGNCTWSYLSSMEKGTYVLYRITDVDGKIYNAAANIRENHRLTFDQINSRFNRGNVPPEIRQAFIVMITALPPITISATNVERYEAMKSVKIHQYNYREA